MIRGPDPVNVIVVSFMSIYIFHSNLSFSNPSNPVYGDSVIVFFRVRLLELLSQVTQKVITPEKMRMSVVRHHKNIWTLRFDRASVINKLHFFGFYEASNAVGGTIALLTISVTSLQSAVAIVAKLGCCFELYFAIVR